MTSKREREKNYLNFLLHKTDIKRHKRDILMFYFLLPPETVGSTPSTGIDGQADRISQIYTGV